MIPVFCTSAATIYNTNGFENPRFTIGSLAGQDAGVKPWVIAGATATVQNTNAFGGTQAIAFSTTTGSSFAYPSPAAVNPTSPASRYVLVDWDENVHQTTTNLDNFGPLLGIDAYDASSGPVKRLGTFGVDATSGELIEYQAGIGPTITSGHDIVQFDTWNHFTIAFDYLNQTYSVYLNHIRVDGNLAFFTAGATNFTDADLAGLKDDAAAFNLSGTAIFDNYTVTTAAVLPEPSMLSWFGLASSGLLSRKSRKFAKPLSASVCT